MTPRSDEVGYQHFRGPQISYKITPITKPENSLLPVQLLEHIIVLVATCNGIMQVTQGHHRLQIHGQ